MSMTEYFLAAFATLLTVTTLIVSGLFFFTYGRTHTKLSLYLAINSLGMAFSAATLMLMRWEFGLPCVSPAIMKIRLASGLICGVLATFSSVGLVRMLRWSRNGQPSITAGE